MTDTTKRRILYICRKWPYPPHGGALMRNYSMIETLGKLFDVDVVCAGNRGDEQPPVQAMTIIPDYSPKMKSALRKTNYIYRRVPYFLADVYPKRVYRTIAEHLATGVYDAVHVSELGAATLLPHDNTTPVVYDSHNYEAGLLARRAEKEKFPLNKLVKRDAKLVRRFERGLIKRSALTLAVSEMDLEDLEDLVPARKDRIFVADNAIDTRLYKPSQDAEPDPNTILITGTLTWRPNIQGLDWFIEDVLPRLTELVPEAMLRVAGRMDDEMEARLAAIDHVQPVPNPPDMIVEFAKASVVAIPVLASSGTRFRMLEAWAAGRPLVTTKAGAFGLPGDEGVHYHVQDSGKGFADAVAGLLRDRDHWNAVQKGGYDMIKLYDFDALQEKLVTAYRVLFPELEP